MPIEIRNAFHLDPHPQQVPSLDLGWVRVHLELVFQLSQRSHNFPEWILGSAYSKRGERSTNTHKPYLRTMSLFDRKWGCWQNSSFTFLDSLVPVTCPWSVLSVGFLYPCLLHFPGASVKFYLKVVAVGSFPPPASLRMYHTCLSSVSPLFKNWYCYALQDIAITECESAKMTFKKTINLALSVINASRFSHAWSTSQYLEATLWGHSHRSSLFRKHFYFLFASFSVLGT